MGSVRKCQSSRAYAKQRLSSLAENPNATISLELDGVETERQPGVAWQVYFGLPPM
jgi:hypothetical protein